MGLLILREKVASTRSNLQDALDRVERPAGIVTAEALYLLGDQARAVSYLRERLGDKELMIRLHALNTLDHMGDAARMLLPEMRELIPEDPKQRPYDARMARYFVAKFE